MPVHPLAKRAIDMLDAALAEFGEYSYYDRGPDEVMDVSALAESIQGLPDAEIRDVLAGICTHPHGEVLVRELLHLLANSDPGLPDRLRGIPELDVLIEDEFTSHPPQGQSIQLMNAADMFRFLLGSDKP